MSARLRGRGPGRSQPYGDGRPPATRRLHPIGGIWPRPVGDHHGLVRAIDRRLLGWGRPTRTYLVTTVLLGSLRALLLIAQAWLLASIVAGAFVGGQDLAALRVPMVRRLSAEVKAIDCRATRDH